MGSAVKLSQQKTQNETNNIKYTIVKLTVTTHN